MIDQFKSTIRELELTYSIVGVLKMSDGNSTLYNQLASLHKAVYDHRERIIILQDCEDVYDYEDLPGQSIINLQKYLSIIDISNFFVLVVSKNSNISKELDQVRLLYSNDQYAIQHCIVDLDSNPVVRQFQDTFCVLPWMHLYAGTDGNVLPCCIADHQFPMGNIRQSTIEEILTSNDYNQLRLNMLTGKRSKQCRQCYQKEDANLSSFRQSHNRQWPQVQLSQVNPNGTLDQVAPVYLDIRLNNICNLKCKTNNNNNHVSNY
jgi:radical SAM protein with 4Fe4S-binding SPASM domain